MNNKIKQVLLGSMLGDGTISKGDRFSTGCKYKEYVDFKYNILKKYASNIWYRFIENNGYIGKNYHVLDLKKNNEVTGICRQLLPDILKQLDLFGLAIWFYDDGSFHQKKMFYNLNTHAFTKQEHELYILPRLIEFGLKPTLAIERKKDGRVFYYVRINKRDGAEIVNKLLKQYPIQCYLYKTTTLDIEKTTNFKRVVVSIEGEIIKYEGINIAAKHTRTYPEKIRSLIKSRAIYKGMLFYYEHEFNDQLKSVGLSSPKQETSKDEDMV